MQICQKHWQALRKAIEDRGMGHLGAKDPQQAVVAITTELEGRGAENDLDPLMGCNWMIFSKALSACGLEILGLKTDGTHYCPICEVIRQDEEWWIQGPADAMLQAAREKGLITDPKDQEPTGNGTQDC